MSMSAAGNRTQELAKILTNDLEKLYEELVAAEDLSENMTRKKPRMPDYGSKFSSMLSAVNNKQLWIENEVEAHANELPYIIFESPVQKSKSTRSAKHLETEITYEPMARWTVLAPLLRGPKGAKSFEHLETLRQSNPCFGTLAPKTDRPGLQEITYEPMARWAALAPMLREPKGIKSVEHLEMLRQSNPCFGTLAPKTDRPGLQEITYEPMARWAALAPMLREPKGIKSVEHLEMLRQSNPCFGTLAPKTDRPGQQEITFDPIARWAALAPMLREPKGTKSVEHLETLRQSNPCFGTLAPKTDRPGQQEITFDSMARWAALAPMLREPKGTKSVEHLEALRQSNPCFGTLAPMADRPGPQEITYDPLMRWTYMAPMLRQPRGTKAVAHMENLRQSNPDYGTLLPSRIANLSSLLAPRLQELTQPGLKHVASTGSRLDEYECQCELPQLPELPVRHRVRSSFKGKFSASDDDDDGSDDESIISAARTARLSRESRLGSRDERWSNDTVASHLADLLDDETLALFSSSNETKHSGRSQWRPPAAKINPAYL